MMKCQIDIMRMKMMENILQEVHNRKHKEKDLKREKF